MLCQSLQQSSANQTHCVVGVVGVAHVPGILHCWEASTSGCLAAHHEQSFLPEGQEMAVLVEDAEAQGVRRALLERFLELSCSPAVCADMQRQLPALPSEAEETYACARELYGSPRMLLAALPREHLNKVSHDDRSHDRVSVSVTVSNYHSVFWLRSDSITVGAGL